MGGSEQNMSLLDVDPSRACDIRTSSRLHARAGEDPCEKKKGRTRTMSVERYTCERKTSPTSSSGADFMSHDVCFTRSGAKNAILGGNS